LLSSFVFNIINTVHTVKLPPNQSKKLIQAERQLIGNHLKMMINPIDMAKTLDNSKTALHKVIMFLINFAEKNKNFKEIMITALKKYWSRVEMAIPLEPNWNIVDILPASSPQMLPTTIRNSTSNVNRMHTCAGKL
jgi:hypothetical protein